MLASGHSNARCLGLPRNRFSWLFNHFYSENFLVKGPTESFHRKLLPQTFSAWQMTVWMIRVQSEVWLLESGYQSLVIKPR